MYASQFFRTNNVIESGPGPLEESMSVMAFLADVRVTGTLCCFRNIMLLMLFLVVGEKTVNAE